LGRVSRYLPTSRLMERKREKLLRESTLLGTKRGHLYLLMAGMGSDGGLLPMSPASMTWGRFECRLRSLTPCWTVARGKVYHWSDISGWSFHRLWPEWDGSV
jgi:hypothetical protein